MRRIVLAIGGAAMCALLACFAVSALAAEGKRLTKDRAKSTLTRYVKEREGATLRSLRVRCHLPREGRSACSVVFRASESGRDFVCSDTSVTVAQVRSRLRVRGYRPRCVEISAQPPGSTPPTGPAPPPPPPPPPAPPPPS
jgi:hypothetical protein